MAVAVAGRDGEAGPSAGCPAPADGLPRGDAAFAAAGWQPRFLADAARAAEAVRLYTDLGFEVLARPLTPDHMGALCDDCQVVACRLYTMVYTRRAGADAPGSEP